MDVTITGRHFKITPALHDYAEKRIEHAVSFYPKINHLHVILSVEKYRHQAEVVLTGKGLALEAKSTTKDMYASLDQVMDKLLRQLREIKRERSSHKHRSHVKPPAVVEE